MAQGLAQMAGYGVANFWQRILQVLRGAPTFAINGTATQFFCHAALDNVGRLFVGLGPTSALEEYTIGSQTGMPVNNANVNGVAWTPNGTIWYLDSNTNTISSYNFNTLMTTARVTSVPTATYQSIAVDSLGNLYVANGNGTGAIEYTAASTWTATSGIGNSVSPTYVSVFPDGLFGANNQVGIPQPTQSPIPIATPPVI